PSYLVSVFGDAVRDYRDWGIPLGRRFRALKLWMTLSLLGAGAIRDRIRHHLELGRRVEAWSDHHPQLEKPYARSPNFNPFRLKSEVDPQGELTRLLGRRINDGGQAYMTHSAVEGRSLLRWVTGQTYTEVADLEATCRTLERYIHEMNLP